MAEERSRPRLAAAVLTVRLFPKMASTPWNRDDAGLDKAVHHSVAKRQPEGGDGHNMDPHEHRDASMAPAPLGLGQKPPAWQDVSNSFRPGERGLPLVAS
jgi:hypothetical protein